MNKTTLTNQKFYEENPVVYEVLTDWIFDNCREVELLGTNPITKVEVNFEDCYLDEAGDLYVPNYYNWSYKGTDEYTDPDEYTPVYDPSTPRLTKLEIANLIAEVEQPELNNPVNFAN